MTDSIDDLVYDYLRRVQLLRDDFSELQATMADHGGAELIARIEAAEAARAEREEAEVAERERLEAETAEHREAIARSMAVRRAAGTVRPDDEYYDEEAEYYQRKSWLV